jgi:hypothetical protein
MDDEGIWLSVDEARTIVRMLDRGTAEGLMFVANDYQGHPMRPEDAEGLRRLAQEVAPLVEVLRDRIAAAG